MSDDGFAGPFRPELRLPLWVPISGRDNGKCQRCGRAGNDAHHRKTKARGGPDCWENLIYLCRSCHDWAHFGDPEQATADGYLIDSWIADDEIATIAVFYFDVGAKVRLGPDGSVNRLEVA